MDTKSIIYRPNTIFWIEDAYEIFESGSEYLSFKPQIIEHFGKKSKFLTSDIMTELPDDEANSHIEELIQEAGEDGAFVNVRTAQMGRAYLEKIVPGAIICDSAFPLNGSVTIKWLQEHGMPGYPLIGLSASRFDELPQNMQHFFIGTSAVYYRKLDCEMSDLIDPIIFSQRYVKILMQEQRKE